MGNELTWVSAGRASGAELGVESVEVAVLEVAVLEVVVLEVVVLDVLAG